MTLAEELQVLRGALAPEAGSTGNTVALHWADAGDKYFNADFVKKAIHTYEHRILSCMAFEEKLNPLEQLGAILLRSAAGLPLP